MREKTVKKSGFIFLFLIVSIFSIAGSMVDSCRKPEEYEIAADNDRFQIIKYDIKVKGAGLRGYTGLVAVTKPGNSSSWFKILTMIKKPVTDTPGCTLY